MVSWRVANRPDSRSIAMRTTDSNPSPARASHTASVAAMPPHVHALITLSATLPLRSTICQRPRGAWITSERIQLVPGTTDRAAS